MSALQEILWDAQKDAVDKIVQMPLRLLADQPGSGKTLMALAALDARGAFTTPGKWSLILAPKTPAKATWMRDIDRFFADSAAIIIDAFSGTGAARDRRVGAAQSFIGDPPVVVVANHEALRVAPGGKPFLPSLFTVAWDAVVIDEAHMVLPTDTDVFGKMTQFWKGLSSLSIQPDGLRLPMSGTPDRSKLENRYGTLKFLFPTSHTNYWNWVNQFFETHKQSITFRSKYTGALQERAITVIGDLKARDRWTALDSIYVIRRTKDEIRAGRQKKQHIPIVLPMIGEQNKAYAAFEQQAKLSRGTEEEISALVYGLRARQLSTATMSADWNPVVGAPSNKMEWIDTFLTERGHMDPEYVIDPENPSKVVIASFLNNNLDWLQAELGRRGIRAEVMKGGQANENARIMREFQDPASPLRVVLLQQGLGVGIDLDMADDLIFLDVPHNSDDTEQIEDRIDRLSRDHRMTIWWLLSSATYDIAVAEENQHRFETTRDVLDGARGIDFARQMFGALRKRDTHA